MIGVVMTHVIGLIGKARSGKDTAASFLTDENYVRVAFADPVKEMLSVIFPDIDFHNGDKTAIVEPYGVTVRDLVVTLGHDWGRKMIGESLWIDIARRKIDHLLSIGKRVVVTDIRYTDEADLILEYFSDLVYIHRQSEGAGSLSNHITENAEWDGYHFTTISNNFSLGLLRSEILDVIR